MLKLLKGDDTGGVFGRKLQFTIQVASGISLDGCYGEFIFDGITKRFDGPLVSGQTREIFYSHNETAGMALGVRMGAFVLVDAAGKRATVGNTYAVKVTNIVSEVYTTPTQTVEIYGAIKWSQIEEKPDVVLSVNGVGPDEDGNVEVTAGAADWDLIENKPEYDGEDLPEEFTEEQMRTKLNDVLDFLRDAFPAAVTAVVAAMCFAATAYGELIVDVTKARKGDLLNSAMIVTNVTVSGSGGIDTNAVKDIVNAEVGGTNTLVHSDAAWVITATNQAANARDRWDNVCHTLTTVWSGFTTAQSERFYMKFYDGSSTQGEWLGWAPTQIGQSHPAGLNKGDVNSVDLTWSQDEWEGGTFLHMTGLKSSTANQPFVTIDNVPSTNGFVTASVTNAVAAEVRTKVDAAGAVSAAASASDLWSESNANLTNRIHIVTTNTVDKAYVEGLGIEAGVSGEGVTNIVNNFVSTNTTMFVTNSALTIAQGGTIKWQESFGGYKLAASSAATVACADHSTTFVTATGEGALTITPPAENANGEARDFIVVINTSGTNALDLAAFTTVYASDESATNAVQDKVTMLYFTEMSAGEWLMGRQEVSRVRP